MTLELACLRHAGGAGHRGTDGHPLGGKRGTSADTIANGIALWGLSVPNFWLGILMILLFSVHLGWLPASGYVPPSESLVDNLKAMAMPAFVLGNAIAAVMMRHTRGGDARRARLRLRPHGPGQGRLAAAPDPAPRAPATPRSRSSPWAPWNSGTSSRAPC